MIAATLMLGVFLLLIGPRLLGVGGRSGQEVHGRLRVLWWINRAYCTAWHRVRIPRLAPLPAHGPALLVANHTCGIDNFLLQAGADRVLGFLIAQEWYDHWLCGKFCRLLGCIPVRRDGRDLAATRAALRAIEDERVVPIFPEGKILPLSGAELGPGKPGAAYLAVRSGVPVIPAYIRGTPATNDIWKSLSTPSHAEVWFGDPIRFAGSGGRAERETLESVTEALMAAIRALKDRAESGPEGCDP
jgi:1-acyl-sn-glycerol-3-phosphate acyltransferase